MDGWGKTHWMAGRLGISDLENDLYNGRPIIHRDSPIDGGVYLGQGQREAIVVDTQKYPELGKLYGIAKVKAQKEAGILRAVFDAVSEAMPRQDNDHVEALVRKYGAGGDRKISLDVFINEGTGVCRHDALACAALLELAIKDGTLDGRVSVDRNSTYLGGHAWCRYTAPTGTVYILDVAQGFVGGLKRASEENRWAYQRPDEC